MKPSTDAARLRESAAESGIVASLAASPLYRERPATAFDLATMLDAEELAAFVQSTQPKEWAKLGKQFPGAEREMLTAQVSALVAKRGTLEVLRNGASFKDSINDAFLSNADEFLNFMSKTETDPAFGKFFFSEMFRWHEQQVSSKSPPKAGP